MMYDAFEDESEVAVAGLDVLSFCCLEELRSITESGDLLQGTAVKSPHVRRACL
jgi:hypothetical protein